MARLAAAQKAARTVAVTNARAALKGSGASEMTGGTAHTRATASRKAVHRSHGAGVRVRKIRLRKIRIRV